jgi:hypothetical protein
MHNDPSSYPYLVLADDQPPLHDLQDHPSPALALAAGTERRLRREVAEGYRRHLSGVLSRPVERSTMTLTLIAVTCTTLYTIALCRAAAHIAHPGWRRTRNRRGKRLAKYLSASHAIK